MIDPNQKLEALNSELQQIAKNYNEAKEVVNNCERKNITNTRWHSSL
jgi:uncharacterized protein YukE